MKILFLTHTFPYPLNDGIRLHIYHILRELSSKHSLSLLCLNDQEVSPKERQIIENLGVKVVRVIVHPIPKNPFLRLINTLFDPVPFFVRQFQSKQMQEELRRYLSLEKTDVLHVDYLAMAVYHNEFKSYPTVFFPHDAVSMLFERNVQNETNLFRKIYTYFQWKKTTRFEVQVIPKFDETMVVSPVDRDYLMQHCPHARISVSPNGVDTEYFCPQTLQEEANTILFRGVMNFLPNADAARFFYTKIFPMILKERPDAKFIVVGKNPPQDLIQASKQDSALLLTGYVDNIRDAMAKASVIVSPMQIGSGIKNKILEPMAMAKPIVATSLSCAGLNVTDGIHLMIADSPVEFAQKVIELLKNPEKRQKLGTQARGFVKLSYTWKKNAEDFERLYFKALAEKK